MGFNTHVCLGVGKEGPSSQILTCAHNLNCRNVCPLVMHHQVVSTHLNVSLPIPSFFRCWSPHLNLKPYICCQQNIRCTIVMLMPLPPPPRPSLPLPCVGLHFLYVYLLSLVAIGHMGLSFGQFARLGFFCWLQVECGCLATNQVGLWFSFGSCNLGSPPYTKTLYSLFHSTPSS